MERGNWGSLFPHGHLLTLPRLEHHGRRERHLRLPRGDLIHCILDVIQAFRPPMVVMEFVAGFCEHHRELANLLRRLRALGYHVEDRLEDSAWHLGINKRRFFTTALRHDFKQEMSDEVFKAISTSPGTPTNSEARAPATWNVFDWNMSSDDLKHLR